MKYLNKFKYDLKKVVGIKKSEKKSRLHCHDVLGEIVILQLIKRNSHIKGI